MTPPSSPSSRVVPLAWLALVAAALWGVIWWWQIGRAVALPEAPSSRVACVSYAPFRKPGETPLNIHAYVSPERIDADLRALSAAHHVFTHLDGTQLVKAVVAVRVDFDVHGWPAIARAWPPAWRRIRGTWRPPRQSRACPAA